MKKKKLTRALSLIMSLELIVSPTISYAKEPTTSTVEKVGTALAIGTTLYGQATGNPIGPGQNPLLGGPRMNPQLQGDMAALQNQQTPLPDKYFNLQKMSKIPGLMNYLAMNNINPQMLECKTLPTTLHEAKNEVCRIGVTIDKGPQGPQMQEAYAYYNQYLQVTKMYSNFRASSNVEGQLFGVGCMKNAMQILGGFFQYRINELDKLTTNLEAIQNQFKQASRSDLDAIEESTAVLEGGNSELTNKVRSKRPDLFDYGKRFNNLACTSIMAANDFDKLGKKKGLNDINEKLKDITSQKQGKFSGESYSKAHASVVEDLNNLADKVGKQAELNFEEIAEKGYGPFLGAVKTSVSSVHGTNGALSADLFADSQTKFSERNGKLTTELMNINSELRSAGVSGIPLNYMTRANTSGNFDNEIETLERNLKNNCLGRSLTGNSSIETITSKIYDPSSSKFANKNAPNMLKDKLKQIMTNDKTSPEKKLAELKALESQQGSRYFLKMESSYEIQDVDAQGKLITKVVEPTTTRSPSAYFSDIIRNCEAQFKVNQLDNKMTGAAAIQRLRKLNQEYRSFAKTHAQEVREQIRNKMINCQSSLEANSEAVGSCTPSRFDNTKPTFCAAAALSCSKNMQQCTQQAEKFVGDMKKERTARVNNYKSLVEKNKQDVVKIFDTALATYMRDGELLRGSFGVGFASPAGIERDLPEGNKYLGSFLQASKDSPDGALLLEDPDKFMAMFKRNIENLKNSVVQQQEQILGNGGGSGILYAHMGQTDENYAKVEGLARSYSDACLAQYDNIVRENDGLRRAQMADQQRMQGEMGEKSRQFCKKYTMAQENPAPACKGNIEDLFSAVSAMPGGAQAAYDLEVVCSSYNNESSAATSGGAPLDVMCQELVAKLGNTYKKCRDLKNKKDGKSCLSGTSVGTGKNETIVARDECDNLEKEIEREYSYYIVNRRGGNGQIRIEAEAPYFCTAGNNSDPNMPPKNIGDAILRGLQQGAGSAATGY